jgi:cytoskeletal protein CcmA (bactofilin family)
VSSMWKPNEAGAPSAGHAPEHASSSPGPTAVDSAARSAVPASDQAIISKGLVITGEITGSESLFIDGKIEGSINLPGNRVTVGRNGKVAASINAREIVVLGKVRGNVSATDRVDIRAEGALTGDVAAARISIEDGAFFKGGIDIRKLEPKLAAPGIAVVASHETPKLAHS